MRSLANTFAEKLLESVSVPNDGNIVMLSSTDTLDRAVGILAEGGIQSAPVVKAEVPETAPWFERFAGVLDMIQVMRLVVRMDKSHSPEELSQFLSSHTVAQILPQDDEGVANLPSNCTLLDAMFMISEYNTRRICVVEVAAPEGPCNSVALHNFLSPSTILELISVCCTEGRTNFGGTRIRDLHLDIPGLLGVLSVHMGDQLMSAFDLMDSMKVTAVAIVGQRGEVIGKVSAADVYNIFRDPHVLFKVLNKHFTVAEYEDWKIANHIRVRALVTCQSHDLLETVIHKMVNARTHRVFVIDARKIPIGVVSIRDIIRALVPDIVELKQEDREKTRDSDDDEIPPVDS